MKLKIQVESDNVGVDNNFDVAEIVRGIAGKISNGQEYGAVRDINGNKVGFWNYEPAEE